MIAVTYEGETRNVPDYGATYQYAVRQPVDLSRYLTSDPPINTMYERKTLTKYYLRVTHEVRRYEAYLPTTWTEEERLLWFCQYFRVETT